ncbi:MAG: glutamine--fructose-6-phosphate transaminase (isomerizing) [Myxococcales bacterium]|nr:glutamine--fructose-6-phosphate transaminase (isomerizing) [Myxococcales bacterium]
MCGIVGYVGEKRAAPLLLDGLRRLEYRGYDSAGLAMITPTEGGGYELNVIRRVGFVAELVKAVPENLAGRAGVGHTRWATHGAVTEANAHPHVDSTGRIAVIHNGIIENFASLRAHLEEEEGVKFRSETDSEVLAHLVRKFYTGDPLEAVRSALAVVTGTWGVAVVFADHADLIIASRNGSPLVVGKGDGETFLASDPHALANYTRSIVYLEDREIVKITREGWEISRLDGRPVSHAIEELGIELGSSEKGSFPHFMLKEIHEQPESLSRCLLGRVVPETGGAKLGGFDLTPREIVAIRRLGILGCGTSFHAGLVGATAMEQLARLPAFAEIASEFRYRNPVISADDLFLAVSQSGETADTLGAIQEAQTKGGRVMGVVNVVGSTIARTCGRGVYVHSGPEIAVASTKAFTSQVAALLVASLMFGRSRMLGPGEGRAFGADLLAVPGRMASWLDANATSHTGPIVDAVELLVNARFVFFLGRGVSAAVAMEGALKLKEVAYIPCMSYPAAEMKHGPIALIDKQTPVVAIVPDDQMRDKTLSNVQEVRARGARVILIHTEGDTEAAQLAEVAIAVPRASALITPLLSVLPLQLFAYRAGLALGRDIDRPRNLAKSVTVE